MKAFTILLYILTTTTIFTQTPDYNFINVYNIKAEIHANGTMFMDENRSETNFFHGQIDEVIAQKILE